MDLHIIFNSLNNIGTLLFDSTLGTTDQYATDWYDRLIDTLLNSPPVEEFLDYYLYPS